VLELTPTSRPTSIEGVLEADRAARACAGEVIAKAI
jgi:hypothetical protein